MAGHDLSDPGVDVRRIRQRVGLVPQYPEQQLFERLVGDDVAFGLKKMGMARSERVERVRRAMEAVGLGFEAFKDLCRPTSTTAKMPARSASVWH